MKLSHRQLAGGFAAASLMLAAAIYYWVVPNADPERSNAKLVPTVATRGATEALPGRSPAASTETLQTIREGALTPEALLPAVAAALADSSLRGTLPDGALRFDANNRLIVDADLRRHVEWWLSLLGEVPIARIRELLQANLANYTPDQARQALAFFDRWIDYLQAADGLSTAGETGARLSALSDLRQRWFGADAQGLFGDEEAYTRAVLARQDALTDPTFTAEQRAEAVALADAELDENQRAMRQASRDPLLASVQTSQFEALNTAPEQRHEERAALWGDKAADRLAQLDQERAQWDARMQAFRSERQQILNDSSLTPEQHQAGIEALLERDFSDPEARRAQALLLPDEEAGN